MNKIKIIVLYIVILAIIWRYSIIDKTNSIYDTNYDSSAYDSISLYSGESVTQSFQSKENILDGISIKIGVIGDQNKTFLEYELYDDSNKKLLREDEFSLEELQSGKFFDIFFESIDNCKDRNFVFSLKVKETSESNGVTLFVTPQVNATKLLDSSDEEMHNTLVFRTLTHRFDFETFFVTICFVLYIVFFMKWMYRLFK